MVNRLDLQVTLDAKERASLAISVPIPPVSAVMEFTNERTFEVMSLTSGVITIRSYPWYAFHIRSHLFSFRY